MHDLFLIIAALLYLAAVISLYRTMLASALTGRGMAIGLTVAGVVLHGVSQGMHWLAPGPPTVSILNILSLCALVVVFLLVVSVPLQRNLFDAGLIALPLATLVLAAELLIDAPEPLLTDVGFEVSLHVVSSVLAFGVLSIAGVYALFVALLDHFLRRHHLNRLVRALPALDVLEGLLFQLIAVGFAFLTLSLVSGLLFVSDLFAQHLAHKTVLSIVAWLIFGTLLWGRRFRGWRGRVAVRLALAGVAVLLLAYFGSKLILEVLLGRNWQV